MKKLILLLLIFPFFASASDFCADGFGTTDVNGTWVESGTHNGKPYYTAPVGGTYAYYPSNGNGWYLGSPALDDSGPYYYSPTTGGDFAYSDPTPATTYVISGGAGPVGTVAEFACGSPAPTPTTTDNSATSTVDQAETNLFFSWVIFFGTMVFVIWFFRSPRI